jgi:hypothetical protein
MTHRRVIPHFHGTPQAVETSHAMWDVPRGWQGQLSQFG